MFLFGKFLKPLTEAKILARISSPKFFAAIFLCSPWFVARLIS